ncbi:hypothetical protein C8R44DRAFT_788317 [Mycena epipterygia]|nr:hypothetical protein C8R44DRAFT_788317 [Mycena epipterygia]
MTSQQKEQLPPLPGPRNPADIVIRSSPTPESPQPMSADEAPASDAQTRPMRTAASQSLPRLPEISPPPEASTSLRVEPSPKFPRPSVYGNGSQRRRSELDWSPRVESKPEPHPRTLEERLLPTLDTAKAERAKYEFKARMTGYALNIAIGLQVLLGALTTGLSAVTSGRQTSIMTAILGGLSTVVASYLARARGSNEPELSIARCKDLEQFVRECEVFVLDFGHLTSNEHDEELTTLRERHEELLGNANGERRLAPV